MVYAFLHLALALYRDYTTHKIYEGSKSKHVIILLMEKKKDYNTQYTEKSKWIIRMSKLHWPNQGKLVR